MSLFTPCFNQTILYPRRYCFHIRYYFLNKFCCLLMADNMKIMIFLEWRNSEYRSEWLSNKITYMYTLILVKTYNSRVYSFKKLLLVRSIIRKSRFQFLWNLIFWKQIKSEPSRFNIWVKYACRIEKVKSAIYKN